MPRTLRPHLSGSDHESIYFALGGKAAAVFARVAHVQRIARLVSEGTSVEIVGTRWSGRTELLRRVHQTLNAIGLTIITVRGVSSGLPLEAIRAALPPASAANRAESISASGLIARLAQILTEGPTVILLDDGDLLDDASWTVLETVHKRTGTPIVGVTLQRATIAPADHLLIKVAHPIVKISLDELKLETLHDLLEERLGGAVAPSLSGRVHTKSAGIPGFALAIVDAALSRGQLRKERSVWRDGPDLWSDDLNGAYEALLFSYPNDVREALEVLALVGPAPVTQAAELVGQELLEIIEGHGLARMFSTGERHLLTVSPPGLGDYFRNQEPSVQRLRLLDHIENVLGRPAHAGMGPASGQGVVASAVRQEELPLVARMFSEAYAVESALTWNDWSTHRDAATAVRVLGLQLTGTASADQMWQVVTETSLAGADPGVEVEFRFLHARWLTVTERPFAEVEAAMTAATGFVHAVALESLLHGLRMERFGIPPDYEDVFAGVAAGEGLDEDVRRVMLAVIRIFAGQAGDALELLDQSDSSLVTRLSDMARGLALFASGRLSEALEWARAQAEAAVSEGDRPSLAAHSYVAALSLLALGRFDDAAEAGNIVTSAGVVAARLLFAPDRALMLTLAMAATRTGRNLAAESFLERAERYLGRSDALPLGSIAFAEAAMVAAEGEPGTAARVYRTTADDLNGRGFALAADGASMLALVTEYEPTAAAEFRPRAERAGGRLYLAYLDARAASRNEDPEALRAAARILRAEHATDEALKHLTYAARLYRDAGEADKSADVRSEIRELMRTEDSVTAWAASRAESSWGLTSRELEIIDDVSAGMSNIDIAGKHSISVRTIETHMRNIRRKTGAVNREEIATFAKGL